MFKNEKFVLTINVGINQQNWKCFHQTLKNWENVRIQAIYIPLCTQKFHSIQHISHIKFSFFIQKFGGMWILALFPGLSRLKFLIICSMQKTCDIMCAVDHVVRKPRSSPSVFTYCKRSKTGGREGLQTRLCGYNTTKLPSHLRSFSVMDASTPPT